MTKRERVMAALARQPVDRPPVSFWRHAPTVDHTAGGLAEAMLAWQRRWDLDFIKVVQSMATQSVADTNVAQLPHRLA